MSSLYFIIKKLNSFIIFLVLTYIDFCSFAQTQQWTHIISPNYSSEFNTIRGITGTSSSDIWAVGNYKSSLPGVYPEVRTNLIIKWDGTSWIQFPVQNFSSQLNTVWDVHAINSGNVWAVGDYSGTAGNSQSQIMHWNGTNWSNQAVNLSTGGSYLFALDAISSNDIWAVGSKALSGPDPGFAYHYNGTSWNDISVPVVGTLTNELFDVDGIASNDVWAVGSYTMSPNYGIPYFLTLHWNGSTWQHVPLPNNLAVKVGRLHSVKMVSANDVWAYGTLNAGGGIILHWNGSDWIEISTAVTGGDFAVLSPNDIYAFGDDIIHWNGSNWSVADPITNHSPCNLNSSIVLPDGEIWTGGTYLPGGNSQTLVYRFHSVMSIWTGNLNTDWHDEGNWTGGIPDPYSDVEIPSGLSRYPAISGHAHANNISIQTGAMLTLTSSASLNLKGNFSGSGDLGQGHIIFSGNNLQTIHALTAEHITVNGAGVSLTGNLTVNSDADLLNGHILLNGFNLSVGGNATGTISGHIITNSTGQVIIKNLSASQTRFLPVGINENSFNPVTITANAGHAPDDIYIRVFQGVYMNGTSGSLMQQVVNRTWLINENIPGGSNVNLELQWSSTEELSGFNRLYCSVIHFEGGTWQTFTPSTASGNEVFKQSITGVNSFSPFAVQTPYTVLPVALSDFSAHLRGNYIDLIWATLNEHQNIGFQIQRSPDGRVFDSIGFVPSGAMGGNSNEAINYKFTDVNPQNEFYYYRLGQLDALGKLNFSRTILIRRAARKELTVNFNSSNPANNYLNFIIQSNYTGSITIELSNSVGQIFQKYQKQIITGTNYLDFNISNFSAGIYYLKIISGKSGEIVTIRFYLR